MPTEATGIEWGIVPLAIAKLLERLEMKIEIATLELHPSELLGDDPRELDSAFLRIAAAAEVADRASSEYRGVFNAYTHKYHRPRPRIGELAAAQGTITQNYAKRYSPRILAVIDTLITENPSPEILREGIRSLGYSDWFGISPALDAALNSVSNPRELLMSWSGTELRGFEL